MPVLIERHGRGLVTEHLLHDFDIRTDRDCEAGGGVSEFVRVQAGMPVIDAGSVGLDVITGRTRRIAIHLHPAVHFPITTDKSQQLRWDVFIRLPNR